MRKAISWAVVLLSVLGSCWWIAEISYAPGPAFEAGLSQWVPVFKRLSIAVLCLAISYIALRYRGWWASLFYAAVALLGTWLAFWGVPDKPEDWHRYQGMAFPGVMLSQPSPLLPAIGLLIIPGVFWYVTARSGWPALISKPIALTKVSAVLVSLLVATAAGAAALDFRIIWSGECHYSVQPFTARLGPQQTVFTARTLGARKLWGPDESQWSPGWRRYWLLASVQKQFWGLPWWDRKFVILLMSARGSGAPPPQDEVDFVDGRRLPGALTRFLPIYETFCTRTGSLADSEADLRVLRDGPPRGGIRIIGRTIRLAGSYPDYRWVTAPLMKVAITGPAGTEIAESDAHGVYDVSGLPPGYYQVGREPAPGVLPSWRDGCRLDQVQSGEIRDCTVTFH
jgi:hypothetical protein